MYEMKGALSGYGPGSAGFPASRLRVGQSPGLTVPDRLVSQPHRPRSTGRPASLFRFVRLPGLPGATRRPPVPGTRCKFQFPGLCIAPGETPWMVPVSCGEDIFTPFARVAQEPAAIILNFFPVHTLSTEFRRLSAHHGGYPPPYAQLLHRSPDVTPRIPATIAHRNHSVFPDDPPLIPNSPPRPFPLPFPQPSSARPPSSYPSALLAPAPRFCPPRDRKRPRQPLPPYCSPCHAAHRMPRKYDCPVFRHRLYHG